jgi:hypothetical protein
MVFPLFHSSLPVAPSSAYTTAGTDFCDRCDAIILASLLRNSPVDTAKTTPLITSGAMGDVRSRDTQPGSSDTAPFCPTTFHATIAPLVTAPLVVESLASGDTDPAIGARIQRVPAASCQVESAPAWKSLAVA